MSIEGISSLASSSQQAPSRSQQVSPKVEEASESNAEALSESKGAGEEAAIEQGKAKTVSVSA